MSRQPFFTPKVLILAKPEATYGTDPVPTAAVNPILAEAWSIEPTFKKLERKYARPYLGATPHMAIGQTYKIKFKTERERVGRSRHGARDRPALSRLQLRGDDHAQHIGRLWPHLERDDGRVGHSLFLEAPHPA